MKRILLIVLLAAACCPAALGYDGNVISISPAALSLKGHAGQMTTQNFKLSNFTDSPYAFKIEVTDVLVENGKRIFIPAGQNAGSIAALAVLPITHVDLQPGQETTIPVTFVLPAETNLRAVAVFFRGQAPQTRPGPKVRMNLGAVVDFSTSDNVILQVAAPQLALQTATTNTFVTEELANVGEEPVVVKGVAAILNAPGKLVGRAEFEQKRLLPGERNAIHATYSATLPSGTYHILCSLEYAGRVVTRTAEFVIP
jgi:hypothetical protein